MPVLSLNVVVAISGVDARVIGAVASSCEDCVSVSPELLLKPGVAVLIGVTVSKVFIISVAPVAEYPKVFIDSLSCSSRLPSQIDQVLSTLAGKDHLSIVLYWSSNDIVALSSVV